VKAVEEKLRHHMDEMALGSPVEPNRTVRSVMAALMALQGFKLEGEGDQAFAGLVACIQRMLVECAQAKQGSVADSDWKAKLAAMEAELKAKDEELSKAKLAAKLAELKAKYFLSGEINSEVDDAQAKLEEIVVAYEAQGAKIGRLDGISVDFDDWHFNVRASNTEPLLRLCLESLVSVEDMEARRDEVLALIRA
jgi:hypothetical protein